MTLNWKVGGVALGLVFFLAVLLVKPIGVSTQFVILDGIIADAVNPDLVTQTDEGYTSTNAYLAKSSGKYAKSVANPMNYSFIFVVAMLIGAAVSAVLRGGDDKSDRSVPAIWAANFGSSPWKRNIAVFLAGFVVLYGARLAGGCTSGHMMSGIMQTALAGYVFVIGAFGAGIPVAMWLYKKGA
jgi:hypothetical protein